MIVNKAAEVLAELLTPEDNAVLWQEEHKAGARFQAGPSDSRSAEVRRPRALFPKLVIVSDGRRFALGRPVDEDLRRAFRRLFPRSAE